jgi:aryl-alcohol dehydrogenase-like predicted oxidoreductase
MPGYGIASQHRVSASDTADILRTAWELGIRHYDTSEDYADASLRCSLYLPAEADVSTKIAPDLAAYFGGCYEHWTPLLLHNPTVGQLEDSGIVRAIDGASIYTPTEALAGLKAGLRHLQVPYHALDQSHARAGVFQAAREAGATVYARQPWGQGLLLMDERYSVEDELMARGWGAGAAADVDYMVWLFTHLCAKYGLTPLEAGLRFSLEAPVDYVVFGVDTVDQLTQDVAIAQSNPPASWPACYQELLDTFKDASLTLASVCTVR